MTFEIEITEAAHLAGITAARAAYNETLVVAEGEAVEDHADYIATDAAYVQFVMERAAQSYANQYGQQQQP
jgi:hypothetical protein